MYWNILLYPFLFVSPATDPVSETLVRVEKVEAHMGTRFQITAYASSMQSGEIAIQKAFSRISKLNGILSDYIPDSELMRLCAQSGKGPVTVGPELFFILNRSQDLARNSDGAFDPTVGPYSVLWRRARKSKLLPSETDLADAKAKVGYQKMTLDPSQRTVALSQPGMRLDLGGIAKGYAADEALAVLKSSGINRALVAAGGDVVCGDAPPGKKGWDIALIPLPGDEGGKRHFVLANGAVSTSGDLEQFVELGGKRFAHILDPKTGLGMTTRQSASVVANRGIESDALTKILLLLPLEKSREILQSVPGASGRLVSPRDAEFPSRGAVIQTLGNFPKLERIP
jgi:thiamine biosynthesis lipoprotein